MAKTMSSSRPYLIRGIHEWILENACTPYVLVSTGVYDVTVPSQHVENDKIILNISPRAVNSLQLGNDSIQFDARFSGVSMTVQFPPSAVMAIYARENGQGMIFDQDDSGGEPSPSPDKPSKPNLRVVK